MGSLSPSLWVLLLLCNSIFFPVGCLNEEGAALFSFKEAIFDDPEGSLTNWNHSHQDPCSWNGIECEQGTVISISLPNKKLSGSLPPSLGSLSSLRHFNLRSNRLHGLLPPELFNGRSLQSLVLYGNSLSGSLPPEIGNLNFLQKLDLSQNLLSGVIPSRLIQCKRLKTLDLSSNNFSGPLPVGFGSSLIALERLNLSYNRLNGSIPGDIGNLSSLQTTADFSHNLFSGPIPENLGNLPEKVYINLAYNHLSGLIPQSGALVNRGPTAFIGNPGLCGPPLKNPCSSGVSATGPFLPSNYTPPVSGADDNASGRSNGKSLSNTSVIAIVVGDVIAIGTIAMVFFYCYSRAVSKRGKRDGGNCDKECACFRKERSESVSENEDRFDLVPLDREVGFDLDELLKASAFVLGKSGIGIVYKVVLGDGVTLAVRRLGEGGVQRFKEFRAEVEAIGKVRNQNIVTLRAYYWSVDEKLLVYDYIPNGNVSEAIHGRAGSVEFSPLSWNSRLKIIRGTAKGLAFLHDFSPKKYVHGDLEPNNILLGLDMEPYISDFGLARLANIANGSPMLQSDRIATDLKPESTTINRGSCYQAPEVLKALKPSQKWDVYSFGVILLEMITGRSPLILLEDSEMDLVRWVGFCIEEKKPLSDVLDPFLAREIDREDEIISVLKIALACVQENPDKRLAMRHIVDALDRIMARVANTREASRVL